MPSKVHLKKDKSSSKESSPKSPKADEVDMSLLDSDQQSDDGAPEESKSPQQPSPTPTTPSRCATPMPEEHKADSSVTSGRSSEQGQTMTNGSRSASSEGKFQNSIYLLLFARQRKENWFHDAIDIIL